MEKGGGQNGVKSGPGQFEENSNNEICEIGNDSKLM